MKYYFLLLFGIFLASCSEDTEAKADKETKQQEKPEAPEKADSVTAETPKSYDYYAGAIGLYGEDVLLEINTKDLTIEGNYWYLKHGKRIKLKGTMAPKSNEWQIDESVKGVVTGHMTLRQKGDSLVGQWYAPGKESTLQSVALKRVLKGKEEKLSPDFETYERTKTITVYDGTEDREEETTDDLRLVRVGDYVLFQYFVIGTNAHVGHINGLAEKISDNRAVFKGENNCELTLTFSGNQVVVSENDCSYYRGMRAYFDGALQKVR